MAQPNGRQRECLRWGAAALIVGLVMLSGSAASATDPDVVVFDNGKDIHGEVKNFKQGKLKFDTDQADNIYIDWDYVRFLTASELFEVYDETGAVYYGSLGTTDTARELVVIGEEESVVLDMDTVVQFEPIEKTSSSASTAISTSVSATPRPIRAFSTRWMHQRSIASASTPVPSA